MVIIFFLLGALNYNGQFGIAEVTLNEPTVLFEMFGYSVGKASVYKYATKSNERSISGKSLGDVA